MREEYVCVVSVCSCCLQAACYAEPCGCDEHATLSLLGEGDYLALSYGGSRYSYYDACKGCGQTGGQVFEMTYWRRTA